MVMPSTAAVNAARAFKKCAMMLPYHGYSVEKLDFGFPSGKGLCIDTSVALVRCHERLVAWRRVSKESGSSERRDLFSGCAAFDSGVRHGLTLKKGARLALRLMPTMLSPLPAVQDSGMFYIQPDAWPVTTKGTYLSDGSKELMRGLCGFMGYLGYDIRVYFMKNRFWVFLDTGVEAWVLMPGMPFGFVLP